MPQAGLGGQTQSPRQLLLQWFGVHRRLPVRTAFGGARKPSLQRVESLAGEQAGIVRIATGFREDQHGGRFVGVDREADGIGEVAQVEQAALGQLPIALGEIGTFVAKDIAEGQRLPTRNR